MAGVMRRVVKGAKKIVRKIVKPDDLDPETRTEADQRKAEKYEPTEADLAKVEFVRKFYRRSQMARRPLERTWILSLAMLEGRQWLGWDDATNRVISLMDEEDQDRYITHNLILPLIQKWVALVTMTRPDAGAAPDSDAPLDVMAASEGRAILGHVDRQVASTLLRIDQAFWLATCGVSFVKHYWDPSAWATIPRFGPDGSLVGKISAPVGEYCRTIVPPWEIYLDPACKRWSQNRRYAHVCVQSLQWLKERFPDRYHLAEPDARDACDDWAGNNLAVGGESNPDWGEWDGEKYGYEVIEYTEYPNPTNKKGQFIVVAGGALMHDGPYPVKWRGTDHNRLNLTRAVYREAVGHPYGTGLVEQLTSPQVGYNRLLTKILRRIEEDKLTVQVPIGSEVGADAFEPGDVEDTRSVRKVYVDFLEGGPLSFLIPPEVSGDVYKLREITWTDMQHIAGIHDPSMGLNSPGVNTVGQTELLQQSDRTQMGLVLQWIEQAAVEEGEWAIALYSENASANLPRMMGLDMSGNPEQARTRALAFKALTNGGTCSMYVVPGSAMPKSPAGQNQQIMEYYLNGLFGPPGSPEAALMAVTLMSLSRSDEVLEHLQRLTAKRDEEQAALMEQENAKAQVPLEIAQQREAAQTERVRMQAEGALMRDQQKADDQAHLKLLEHALQAKAAEQNARLTAGTQLFVKAGESRFAKKPKPKKT